MFSTWTEDGCGITLQRFRTKRGRRVVAYINTWNRKAIVERRCGRHGGKPTENFSTSLYLLRLSLFKCQIDIFFCIVSLCRCYFFNTCTQISVTARPYAAHLRDYKSRMCRSGSCHLCAIFHFVMFLHWFISNKYHNNLLLLLACFTFDAVLNSFRRAVGWETAHFFFALLNIDI